MKSIKENVQTKYEINKSVFIACLYKIRNKDDINKHLIDIKNIYKNATHYCYAYIFGNEKKAFDDKEPKGTAGNPIIEVLDKNNLNYILCIIVRYFGGIKLGSGGLIRAYSKSTSLAISESKIIDLIDGYEIEFYCNYQEQPAIEKILEKFNYKKEYDTAIKFTAYVNDKIINEFDKRNIKYNIIKKDKIELE